MFRTMQRISMSAVTLALFAGIALAQAPAPAPGGGGPGGGGGGRGGRGGRGGGGRGLGSVASISADKTSITLKNAAGMATSTALPKDVPTMTLKAAKVADIKDGSYASVRGIPAQDGGTGLTATMITVSEKAPADTKGAAAAGGFGGVNTGLITVKDGKLSLKAGDAMMELTTSDTTLVYMESASKIDDVKVGNNVLLNMKPGAGGPPTEVESVSILPDGPLPNMGGGRGGRGGRGGAGGGGRRGAGGGGAGGGAGAPPAPAQ